ncbi:MAG: MarR family winged helix-turn-helix transcriptional regulator [Firmicutes bacterium]|nr:MarR family winged helix-turn-helix transcriptional regulator [Bacillota bacterium]
MDATGDKSPDRAQKEKFILALFKFRKFAQSVAQVLDVSLGEFMVLAGISERARCDGDFRASEAMEFLGVTKPAVSQILNSLEKKGFVTRRISDSDRRRIRVGLTDSGLETVVRLKGMFDRAITEVMDRFGEEDFSKLTELLARFESVSEEIKNLYSAPD